MCPFCSHLDYLDELPFPTVLLWNLPRFLLEAFFLSPISVSWAPPCVGLQEPSHGHVHRLFYRRNLLHVPRLCLLFAIAFDLELMAIQTNVKKVYSKSKILTFRVCSDNCLTLDHQILSFWLVFFFRFLTLLEIRFSVLYLPPPLKLTPNTQTQASNLVIIK